VDHGQLEQIWSTVSGGSKWGHVLGEHLACAELGRFRAIAALWREGEPGVFYALGRYRELSRRLEAQREHLLPGPAGTGLLDLRSTSGAFHAVPYAPPLTRAEEER
jgi:hypothetical protein